MYLAIVEKLTQELLYLSSEVTTSIGPHSPTIQDYPHKTYSKAQYGYYVSYFIMFMYYFVMIKSHSAVYT